VKSFVRQINICLTLPDSSSLDFYTLFDAPTISLPQRDGFWCDGNAHQGSSLKGGWQKGKYLSAQNFITTYSTITNGVDEVQ